MTKIPSVAFVTTIDTNVGDEFVLSGIRRLLREVIGPFTSHLICKHKGETLDSPTPHDDGPDIGDKILNADIVVQAGAPVYWSTPEGGKSYEIGWHGAIWGRIAERAVARGKAKNTLNLGAGSFQRNTKDIRPLRDDPLMVDFAREAGKNCSATVVRDDLASRFLHECRVGHHRLPCPAMMSGWGKPWVEPMNHVAFNFMPGAGHHSVKDRREWLCRASEIVREVRSRVMSRISFIAHDADEFSFMSAIAGAGEPVYHPCKSRYMLENYGRFMGIISNRVHAGVAVLGYGRPAIVIGNDSRLGTVELCGGVTYEAWQVNPSGIADQFRGMIESQAERPSLRKDLLAIRDNAAAEYIKIIRDSLVL